MNKLALKIPPLLLMLIFMGLMWLVSLSLPTFTMSDQGQWLALLLFTAFGVLITLAGVISFKKAQTTVNPTKPDTSSSLVTSGIYQYTRNPMYVGFTSVLIGWGVFLTSLYALILVVIFIIYLTHFQIRPEEKILRQIFQDEFVQYQAKVRRWL